MEKVYQQWITTKRGKKNMRTNNRQALQEVSKSKRWPLCISKSASGAVSKITGQQNVYVEPQNRQMNFGFKTQKHNLEQNGFTSFFNKCKVWQKMIRLSHETNIDITCRRNRELKYGRKLISEIHCGVLLIWSVEVRVSKFTSVHLLSWLPFSKYAMLLQETCNHNNPQYEGSIWGWTILK